MNSLDITTDQSGVEKKNIIVVGAGIMGVISALVLQREGHQVTLLDANEPGKGCSFGNAGMLARSSFAPLSNPNTILQAPGWLLNPNGPLCVSWSYLVKIIPWLFNYIKAGFKGDLVERGEDMHKLTGESVELYKALAASINCSELITETDYLQIYRTKKGFHKAEGDINERRRLGYKIKDLTTQELHDLEPNLSSEFQYGHLLFDHAFVRDPHALVTAIFNAFIELGGTFIQQQANAIKQSDNHCEVITPSQTISCDKLVITAGAFSAKLIKTTGVNIPLETERGYHINCPNPKTEISRPIMDGDLKFFVSPMNMGYRFAGLVEFAGLEAPLQEQRIKMLTGSAKQMLPDLDTTNSTSWLGFRPTLSDSLPVIDTSPDNNNIIYAFGHQHLGLTCGPITALLVSDLVAQRQPRIDISKYTVKRFL